MLIDASWPYFKGMWTELEVDLTSLSLLSIYARIMLRFGVGLLSKLEACDCRLDLWIEGSFYLNERF